MDQSNAAPNDGDIRTTAVQVALAACNKPDADPFDFIDVARGVYLFLIRRDPVIDVVHSCCDEKVVHIEDYIGKFDE